MVHYRQIEEAISTKKLSLEGLRADTFRAIHNLPECKIVRIFEGLEMHPANADGVQMEVKYYSLKCTTHNVSSG
jgi:hypothetical protein